MALPIPSTLEPMEASQADALPRGSGWLYEPKWDGFRCLAYRDGRRVELRSKAGKPLGRYFPDLVTAIGEVEASRFVLDGEIVIPVEGAFSFDDLLLRIHPAASRVKSLAEAHPAQLIAFDLLVDASARDLTGLPLAERRSALVEFSGRYFDGRPALHLSPQTADAAVAGGWLSGTEGLDGVMAKRADLPYAAGERTAMTKVKRMRTADCVVGGFRWSKNGRTIGSLLLGVYGPDRRLHHIGFCSALNAALRREADARVIPLAGGEGFSGSGPSTTSRWRKEGTGEWEPVAPEVVVEVEYDHFTQGRFRHGTRFLRWRPDKAPRQCTLEQVEKEARSAIRLL
jgi:ATP-dependent DNA ligase